MRKRRAKSAKNTSRLRGAARIGAHVHAPPDCSVAQPNQSLKNIQCIGRNRLEPHGAWSAERGFPVPSTTAEQTKRAIISANSHSSPQHSYLQTRQTMLSRVHCAPWLAGNIAAASDRKTTHRPQRQTPSWFKYCCYMPNTLVSRCSRCVMGATRDCQRKILCVLTLPARPRTSPRSHHNRIRNTYAPQCSSKLSRKCDGTSENADTQSVATRHTSTATAERCKNCTCTRALLRQHDAVPLRATEGRATPRENNVWWLEKRTRTPQTPRQPTHRRAHDPDITTQHRNQT